MEYQEPQVTIIPVQEEDIITTSGTHDWEI